MNSLIGTREAARRLNISIRRIQALIAAGRLPAEKIGNSYAIKENDLAKVNSRKNGHPSNGDRSAEHGRRAELLERILGRVSFGPSDMATNKEHMESYGRD